MPVLSPVFDESAVLEFWCANHTCGLCTGRLTSGMPCLLAIIAYAFPRVVIVLVWLFSGYLGRAYQTPLWPILGFVFMPLTTLAYALAINSHGSLSGFYLFIFIIAVLLDLGTHGVGPLSKRRKRG